MFLNILKLIHVLLGTGQIYTATVLVIGLFSSHTEGHRAVRFLKWNLAASATGLLLSLRHTGLIGWTAMFGVYLSALSVFAWHKCRANNRWLASFVFGTLGVLCIGCIVLCAHFAKLLVQINLLTSAEFTFAFLVSSAIGSLFYVLLCIFVTTKFRR